MGHELAGARTIRGNRVRGEDAEFEALRDRNVTGSPRRRTGLVCSQAFPRLQWLLRR